MLQTTQERPAVSTQGPYSKGLIPKHNQRQTITGVILYELERGALYDIEFTLMSPARLVVRESAPPY